MNLRAEVQLLRDARQYREAYSLQKSLVDQSPTDDDLAYELAMLADKIGEHRTMERLLRQIMVRNPSYHHAYNALGYSLAERGARLAEAKELILKALSFAPKDPFITTAWPGWSFARATRRKRCACWRRPLASPRCRYCSPPGRGSLDPGNQERAKAIWRESLRLNPDNETLRETLQRLNIKL